jgi:hypothetical protein
MQHVWGKERCKQDFGAKGDMKVEGHFEDPGVGKRIILQWIFKKWDGKWARTGLIWLRIGTGGGLL